MSKETSLAFSVGNNSRVREEIGADLASPRRGASAAWLLAVAGLMSVAPQAPGADSGAVSSMTSPASGAKAMLSQLPLAEHRWNHRLLVILAPSAQASGLRQTLDLLQARHRELDERQIVVYTVIPDEPLWTFRDGQLTTQTLRRPWAIHDQLTRTHRLPSSTPQAILIGKDGQSKAAYPLPLELDRVFATIDAMPMRRAEVQRQ